MNGIKLSETLVMPRFNVGAGTGVRASTVHGSEGPLLELYLRSVLFFKIRAGCNLNKSTRPAASHRRRGRKDNRPLKARKALQVASYLRSHF